MSSSAIVQKLWNYCNVLRDDGMSYGDYVEQLTYLLFLKMADERTKPPYKQPSPVPERYGWQSLLKKDGDKLFDHYRHILAELGKEKGLLGLIFGKSQNKFQTPARLERLIKDLVDKENWSAMSADVKGDAYEGLLEKNAQDIKSGAGQYFTPRALIKAMVDAIDPKPGETICDPACGTGGFLFLAHNHIVEQNPNLTRAEKIRIKESDFKGWEIVHGAARVCAMNLLLHGIGTDEKMPIIVGDALAKHPGEYFNSDKNPNGRWRAYDYDELINRDKASLDIFWLKDESLEESENLPTPDVLAQEIVEDLETALEQFKEIATDLGPEE